MSPVVVVPPRRHLGRKVAAGVAIGLGLALASVGVAQAAPSQATMLAHAEQAAVSYWHGNPTCGAPSVSIAPTMPQYAAFTSYDTCSIAIDPSVVSATSGLDYLYLASVVTHEYGHLVLGPTYFGGEAHSPDPSNIMEAGPLDDPILITTRQALSSMPRGFGKASYRHGTCTVRGHGQLIAASEPCTITS